MSKLRILFDRVRSEEKLLEEKAIELGHDTKMIDAKITQVNTESKKSDFDFGDVVFERCLSYFRGLHFTACLEFLDVPVTERIFESRTSITPNERATSRQPEPDWSLAVLLRQARPGCSDPVVNCLGVSAMCTPPARGPDRE